jgi:hypothetical protein
MTFDWNHDWKCGKSLTLKASCIRNSFHQGWKWMENSIVTFWDDWGKTSGTTVQTIGATIPEPSIMTMLWLTGCLSCGRFWLLQRWQSYPTLPTHRNSPPVNFSYSRRWNCSSRGDILTALKRSDQIAGWDQRHWWEMTSSSVSDHENPAGNIVSMRKGNTSKGMEVNRNFCCLATSTEFQEFLGTT